MEQDASECRGRRKCGLPLDARSEDDGSNGVEQPRGCPEVNAEAKQRAGRCRRRDDAGCDPRYVPWLPHGTKQMRAIT